MKKFKANSIDLKKMDNIRGGEKEWTVKETSFKTTKKEQQIVEKDVKIEVSLEVQVES
jgi:hypothetical protein